MERKPSKLSHPYISRSNRAELGSAAEEPLWESGRCCRARRLPSAHAAASRAAHGRTGANPSPQGCCMLPGWHAPCLGAHGLWWACSCPVPPSRAGYTARNTGFWGHLRFNTVLWFPRAAFDHSACPCAHRDF